MALTRDQQMLLDEWLAMSDTERDARLGAELAAMRAATTRIRQLSSHPAEVCVIEPTGNPRPLDDILPWRTAPLPATGDPCGSCGHHFGCADDCC